MAHRIESLLGETVVRSDGQTVPVRSLCGKDRVVGLYFSASWCAPCKTFTPILTSFYESLRQDKDQCRDQLEVVQISWDRDVESHNEAMKMVPWVALTYEDRDRQRKLSRKMGVHGIPKLVLIDGETGSVITRHGYDLLTEDATGSGFPWRRKALRDVITGKLLRFVEGSDKREEVEATTALDGHIVGFYFSAHWSPPCRYFDGELVRAYEEVKAKGHKFEVVFGSVDRSQEAFDRHTSSMPWLTLPFEDERNVTIKKHLGVDGIPMFVLVDEKGVVITMNGRQALTEDPTCKDFPWHPKPVDDLTATSSLKLNENICVVLFTDGSETGLQQGRDALHESASREASKAEYRELFFYVAMEDDFSDTVRDFADLDDTCPLLIILDSPEQNVYVCPEVKVTPKIATEFVDKFLRGELTPTSIPPIQCGDVNDMEASSVSVM